MNTQTLLPVTTRFQSRTTGQPNRPSRQSETATPFFYRPAPPALRAALLSPVEKTPDWPETPTLRLLEVSCGLTHEQAMRLLSLPAAAPKIPAPAHASYAKFNRMVFSCGWAMFLATFVFTLFEIAG